MTTPPVIGCSLLRQVGPAQVARYSAISDYCCFWRAPATCWSVTPASRSRLFGSRQSPQMLMVVLRVLSRFQGPQAVKW